MLSGRYIHNGDNILLLGPPGVGKTHLAISMAFEAITNGHQALFITANDFIAECQKAEKQGLIQRIIKRYSRPELLIIDELGYFSFDELSAHTLLIIAVKMSHLCGVLSQSLRRKEPPFAECRATINRKRKSLLYNNLAC